MADWSKPTITSNYLNFVDEVKARDVDAITLSAYAITTPPVNSIRLLRSPTKFQEWDGSKYVDKVLSVEGGGTGQNTLANLGPALGLGTMAYQNSNAVAITAGNVTNVGLTNCAHGGTWQYYGTQGMVVNTGSGSGIGIDVTGNTTNWAGVFRGPTYGAYILAGSTKTDYSLLVHNAAQNQSGLMVRGDQCTLIQFGLVIPIGTNKYVPV